MLIATDNCYYQNYKHLSSKDLRRMLFYEHQVDGDKERFNIIRYILSSPRTTMFRIGKTYIEKEL